MKPAFTMIELIFVIVILGILSAVAIPKLSATRDDAAVTKEIINAKQTLSDAQNEYTALGKLSDYPATKCYKFDSKDNGVFEIKKENADDICSKVYASDLAVNLVNVYTFGGRKVKF